jgi:diadenosine tetraphosphatase ApaH/serine/threonine PP2A family protein phosphatase
MVLKHHCRLRPCGNWVFPRRLSTHQKNSSRRLQPSSIGDADAHLEFLDRLQSWFACGDYFFVHAGVRPGIALRDQQEKDLLWIRDEFLQSADDFGKIVIHGHTPVPSAEIRINRINIDTYATGLLTCLILERDKSWFMAA